MSSKKPANFSMVVGEGTDFEALVRFKYEADICGEGYEGYSFDVVFMNQKFNTILWDVEDYMADEAGIREYAQEHYKLIVDFIKEVRNA